MPPVMMNIAEVALQAVAVIINRAAECDLQTAAFRLVSPQRFIGASDRRVKRCMHLILTFLVACTCQVRFQNDGAAFAIVHIHWLAVGPITICLACSHEAQAFTKLDNYLQLRSIHIASPLVFYASQSRSICSRCLASRGGLADVSDWMRSVSAGVFGIPTASLDPACAL